MNDINLKGVFLGCSTAFRAAEGVWWFRLTPRPLLPIWGSNTGVAYTAEFIAHPPELAVCPSEYSGKALYVPVPWRRRSLLNCAADPILPSPTPPCSVSHRTLLKPKLQMRRHSNKRGRHLSMALHSWLMAASRQRTSPRVKLQSITATKKPG